jgi:hypothetical protein
MNTPVASLKIWQFLLIALSIGIIAGLAIKWLTVENMVTSKDGVTYLKTSFLKPLTAAEKAKAAENKKGE